VGHEEFTHPCSACRWKLRRWTNYSGAAISPSTTALWQVMYLTGPQAQGQGSADCLRRPPRGMLLRRTWLSQWSETTDSAVRLARGLQLVHEKAPLMPPKREVQAMWRRLISEDTHLEPPTAPHGCLAIPPLLGVILL
jgi:hypothetical protein